MIFISYRRADSESVIGRIDSELKNHFPTQDVFLDHDSIPSARRSWTSCETVAAEGCEVNPPYRRNKKTNARRQ